MTVTCEKLLLNKNQTIEDALVAINSNPSLKIALVVDSSNFLEGVVTDGDVRRGLLAKYTLDTPVFKNHEYFPCYRYREYIKKHTN